MNIISSLMLKLFGSMLLLVGLVGFGASIMLYMDPLKDVEDPNKIKAAKVKHCSSKTITEGTGFSAKPNTKKGEVRFTSHNLEDWQTNLATASYIMRSCEGMKLDYFCMGRNCKDAQDRPVYGLVMKMKFMKPKIN